MATKVLTGAISFILGAGMIWQQSRPTKPTNLRASTQIVPAEFFGMHIHHAGSSTPWPDIPFSEWRLWDAYVAWPSLEPQKGKWHFETLDKYVALAERNNVGILLPLGLTPQWASARPQEKSTYQPGNAAEPRDIEDWRNYVRTVASRYRGRIHEYEIWNEPNSKSFWTGNVDQMVDLTREAAQIIRGIDSESKIVSPAATTMNGVPWLAEFLSKGGAQFVDVVGFHLYVTPQPPETMVLLIREVKRVMKENGAGDKPLWDTETGWSGPKPFPSPQLAASYLARAEFLAWAGGVDRMYWYAWDNHAWASLQTTEADNHTFTAAGKAYGIVHEWLAGAEMAGCEEGPKSIWICPLIHDGKRQWIVWSPAGTKSFETDLPIGSQTNLSGESRNISGERIEVGTDPILFTSAQK
jgi:hypothetical protein